MPLKKEDEQKQENLVADMLSQYMEAIGNSQFGGTPQLEGFVKGIGALESRFSRLVDVMDDFYSRMDKMAKGQVPGFGQGGSSQSSERGALFRAGKDEQLRVLEYMKENWGKPGVDAAGRRVEIGPQGISRDTGWHVDDIKSLERMADRGKFGNEQKDVFGALRDANLAKQAVRQNVDIFPAGSQKAQANAAAAAEKMGASLVETISKNVSAMTATTVVPEAHGFTPKIGEKSFAVPPSGGMPIYETQGSSTVSASNKTGGAGAGKGGGGGFGGGGFGGGGDFDLSRFIQFASPFSPMSLAWSAMFGMSGQLFPAFQGLSEPSMVGGEWVKQGIRGTPGFGATFTGLPALGKLFNQVAGTDAFELYESMHTSFTVLKNVYKSQEKAAGTIQQSIQLARQTPLEVNDLLKIFSTFSVNPQLRGVLSNKEQMGQLATGVAGLSFLVPEQGTEGAIFAIREALAGQYRSIRNRFNINPELIAASGGMSMTEMQSKPTNFLSALDSFLKQNLGQDTFSELQNTFSKQVGNIYDALTGGIFKTFKQGGMYQSVTGFAAEMSNLTGNMFESDMFGSFFKDFGGKVTNQFTQASNILKSIDFQTDAPEDIQNKFGKSVTLITKDLITSLAPNMDKVIDAVSPAAKSIGSSVSNALSRSVSSIFGGAIGIGMNSIVNTLEMPFTALGKAVLPTSAMNKYNEYQAAQGNFIAEHPVMTFAAGYMGSRMIQNMVKGVTSSSGGFKPYLSDLQEGRNKSPFGNFTTGLLERLSIGGVAGSGWKGVVGLASLPLAIKAFSDIVQSLKAPTDVEGAQESRFNRYKSGRMKFSEYQGYAFQEALEGPQKQEGRGFGGYATLASAIGLGTYSYLKNASTREGSWVDKAIKSQPIFNIGPAMEARPDVGGRSWVDLSSLRSRGKETPYYVSYATQEKWDKMNITERGRAVGSHITDMVWDDRDRKFYPSKEITKRYPGANPFTPGDEILGYAPQSIRPTLNATQKKRANELMEKVTSKLVPESLDLPDLQPMNMDFKSRMGRRLNSFSSKLGKWMHEQEVRVISPDELLSKEKIETAFGSGVNVREKRLEHARQFIDKNVGVKMDDQGNERWTVNKPSKMKYVSAGAALLGTAAIAGLDALMPESENMTSKDKQNLKRWTSFGQGLTSFGSMAMMSGAPPLQAAGAIAMGAGVGIDLIARAGYGFGLFGNTKEANEQEGKRRYRIAEVNKQANTAMKTIMDNKIGEITDFAEMDNMKDMLSMDWGSIFNQDIESMVSKGKISQETANRFKEKIPKLAQDVVEGRVKENADDIKQMLLDSDVEIADNLKKLDILDNGVLNHMFSASKFKYIQSKKPGALQQLTEVERNQVGMELASNPIYGGIYSNQRDKYSKFSVQGAILQKSDELNQLSDLAEKSIAIKRYESKGGTESYESSQKFARIAVDQLKGQYDIEGAWSTLKQYMLPTKQYVSDKVFPFKEDAKQIFNSDSISNIGATVKGFQSYLGNTYQKQLLYFTNPTDAEKSSWIEGKQAKPFTEKQMAQQQEIAKKQNSYVGVMPFLADQFAMSMPMALSAKQLADVGGSRMGASDKAYTAAMNDYLNVDQRSKNLTDGFNKVSEALGVFGSSDQKATAAGKLAMKNLVKAAVDGFSYIGNEKSPKDVEKLALNLANQNLNDPSKFKEEMLKNGFIGNRAELDKAFNNYSVATKYQDMISSSGRRDYGNTSSNVEIQDIVKRSLSEEAAYKIAGTAQEKFSTFNESFKNISQVYNYGMQGTREALSGAWAGGGAQPYRYVGGKLMESSFSIGGHEFGNPWMQLELDQQRRDQAYSPTVMNEMSRLGGIDSTQAKDRYARVLSAMERFDKFGGGLTASSFQVLDQVKTMASDSGAVLGGDLLGREAILRKKFTMNAGAAFDSSVLPAFEQGNTEFVNQLMQKYGVGPANFKEGTSPMESAAQMSGLGEALNALGQATTNFTSAIMNAGTAVTDFASKLQNNVPDGNKNVDAKQLPSG